jgi:hypothetical protein
MPEFEKFSNCLTEFTQSNEARNSNWSNTLRAAGNLIASWNAKQIARPPRFNIFEAIGCAFRETAHSSFLSYLLNPFAEHGQGTLFLKTFLLVIREASIRQNLKLNIQIPENRYGWSCRTEEVLADDLGRSDIVIRGPCFISVIENKIHAADQDAQIGRYWEFVKKYHPAENDSKIVVYLTPDGRNATMKADFQDRGRKDAELKKHFLRISYHEDIAIFARKSYEELERSDSALSVREILLQYESLARRIS